MRIKAFIFDMDGTAIDSMPYHAQSWVGFAKTHQIGLDLPELMRKTTGRNGHECMEILFDRPLSKAQATLLIDEKEALYRQLFGPVFREVSGFSAFFERAHAANLKLGFGSAGDQHNLAFAFSHLALKHAPQAVVGGDQGFPGKPSPAIFLEVARQLGVLPGECIVFEDAPFGIEAAKSAGMRAVGITTSHTAQELAGSHVLTLAADFRALIDSHFVELALAL